jgi:beta-lactamase class A
MSHARLRGPLQFPRMSARPCFPLFLLAALPLALPAQTRSQSPLHDEIVRIAAQAHGRVAVSCAAPGKALNCGLDSSELLPMMSVYKLPIAVAVFHAVETGHLSLSQKLHFVPSDLIAPTGYSPLRDQHPHGAVDDTVEDLLRRSIVDSDNVASDVLLRAIGGPAAAEQYLGSIVLYGIQIRDYEGDQDRNLQLLYRNVGEAHSLVALLLRLSQRSPLTPAHTQLLLGWMTASHTGDQRLGALLPPGTVVAAKTGTAGQDRTTINVTNDVGLITLPNGQRLAIAVLIADSSAPYAVRQRVIAEIARAIYDAALQ